MPKIESQTSPPPRIERLLSRYRAFLQMGALLTLAILPATTLRAMQSTLGSKSLAKAKSSTDTGKDKASEAKPEKNAYDYNLPGPDGKDLSVSTFKGKYVLIVNLARKSTYNDQLTSLIKLNDTYKDKGLVVIGVPSNDFGAEEPGTTPEILKAYTEAKVDFPIMSVSKISGDDELPLFTFLTKSKGAPSGGPVHWNYTKFVIDKKGSVVARLDPDVAPDSPEMLSTIDKILDGTYKPKKDSKSKAPAGEDDDDD